MAIGFVDLATHSRARGHSVAAALAYRAGIALRDCRTDKLHDYSRRETREEVAATWIASSRPTPIANDLQALADAIESREKHPRARILRDLKVGIPHELNLRQKKELAHRINSAVAQRLNTVSAAALHAPSEGGDDRNWHAHVAIATRSLTEDGGLGEKMRRLDNERHSGTEVAKLRTLVEDVTNDYLREQNIDTTMHTGRVVNRETVTNVSTATINVARRRGAKRGRKGRSSARDLVAKAVANGDLEHSPYFDQVARQHSRRQRSDPNAPAPRYERPRSRRMRRLERAIRQRDPALAAVLTAPQGSNSNSRDEALTTPAVAVPEPDATPEPLPTRKRRRRVRRDERTATPDPAASPEAAGPNPKRKRRRRIRHTEPDATATPTRLPPDRLGPIVAPMGEYFIRTGAGDAESAANAQRTTKRALPPVLRKYKEARNAATAVVQRRATAFSRGASFSAESTDRACDEWRRYVRSDLAAILCEMLEAIAHALEKKKQKKSHTKRVVHDDPRPPRPPPPGPALPPAPGLESPEARLEHYLAKVAAKRRTGIHDNLPDLGVRTILDHVNKRGVPYSQEFEALFKHPRLRECLVAPLTGDDFMADPTGRFRRQLSPRRRKQVVDDQQERVNAATRRWRTLCEDDALRAQIADTVFAKIWPGIEKNLRQHAAEQRARKAEAAHPQPALEPDRTPELSQPTAPSWSRSGSEFGE